MRDRLTRRISVVALAGAIAILAASCSSSAKSDSTATTTPGSTATTQGATTTAGGPSVLPVNKTFGVGELTETFVDSNRSTAANGSVPGHAGRTLVTTIFYPAQGIAVGSVTKNARPDRADGPYPLIVFAHGFGSTGVEYQALLERWAAAGYVVAAPLFPLSNGDAKGGPDAGDYVNQPGDMSYVITGVLASSGGQYGPLAGLVDPKAVGAAGHSLGGITTLGLAANTCCHDARLKAAIVFSGDSESFPHGRFDYTQAPPLLFVHGNADPLVPYESSVDAFNAAQGPKGLITVVGGGHGSTVDPKTRAFPSIVRATTDFFNAYLKGDTAATGDIEAAADAGVTNIVFESTAGSQVTVPTTTPPPVKVHHATATPDTALTNGQTVAVSWSDYTPMKTVNIVECSNRNTTDATSCDLKTGSLLQPDPTGSGSGSIKIVAGAVGSGTCDATHPDCVIVVNDGGSLDASESVRIPISFAAG